MRTYMIISALFIVFLLYNRFSIKGPVMTAGKGEIS